MIALVAGVKMMRSMILHWMQILRVPIVLTMMIVSVMRSSVGVWSILVRVIFNCFEEIHGLLNGEEWILLVEVYILLGESRLQSHLRILIKWFPRCWESCFHLLWWLVMIESCRFMMIVASAKCWGGIFLLLNLALSAMISALLTRVLGESLVLTLLIKWVFAAVLIASNLHCTRFLLLNWSWWLLGIIFVFVVLHVLLLLNLGTIVCWVKPFRFKFFMRIVHFYKLLKRNLRNLMIRSNRGLLVTWVIFV